PLTLPPAPPHLHSVPTRRSSDLHPRGPPRRSGRYGDGRAGSSSARGDDDAPARGPPRRRRWSRNSTGQAPFLDLRGVQDHLTQGVTDRGPEPPGVVGGDDGGTPGPEPGDG